VLKHKIEVTDKFIFTFIIIIITVIIVTDFLLSISETLLRSISACHV
jgi:hypothetical protein